MRSIKNLKAIYALQDEDARFTIDPSSPRPLHLARIAKQAKIQAKQNKEWDSSEYNYLYIKEK